MRFVISRSEAKALASFCVKPGACRPELENVSVESRDGGVLLCATNGHVGLMLWKPADPEVVDDGAPLTEPGAIFPHAIASMRAKSGMAGSDDWEVQLIGGRSIVRGGCATDTTYDPDHAQATILGKLAQRELSAEVQAPPAGLSLSPEYAELFGEAARKLGSNGIRLVPERGDVGGVWVIFDDLPGGGRALGLWMPLRVAESEDAGGWKSAWLARLAPVVACAEAVA